MKKKVMDIKIKCPKCGVEMKKLSNGKYVIDKCPKCEGIFLDSGESQKIGQVGFFKYMLDYFRRD